MRKQMQIVMKISMSGTCFGRMELWQWINFIRWKGI